MAWSDDAWKAIEDVYKKVLELDFVHELGTGALSKKRFITYMEQDKLYLDDYSRALAYVAARAPTPADAAQFAKFAQSAAEAEQSLHNFYLDSTERTLEKPRKNPTCELYTSYLLRHTATSPIELGAAAVLPCFWIYDAVGVHHTEMLRASKDPANHPYAKWIEMYSSEDFSEGTRIARAFADKLAEEVSEERRQAMTEVFVQASIMELMFWKASWDDEKWIA